MKRSSHGFSRSTPKRYRRRRYTRPTRRYRRYIRRKKYQSRRRSRHGFKRTRRKFSRASSRYRDVTRFGFLPKVGYAKLTYGEQFTLNAAAGGVDAAFYKLNDCYDPTGAVGGHQPMGFDQMMSFYDRYVVMSASVSWTCGLRTNTTTGNKQYMFLYLEDSAETKAYTPVDVEQLIEYPNIQYRLVDPNEDPTMSQAVSMPKFFNRSKANLRSQSENGQFSGDTGTSPARTCSAYLGVMGYDFLNDPPLLYATVKIEMNVMFFERKLFAQS